MVLVADYLMKIDVKIGIRSYLIIVGNNRSLSYIVRHILYPLKDIVEGALGWSRTTCP